MKTRLLTLATFAATLASASAALTHRWTLNETSLSDSTPPTGILETVSNTTIGALFGTIDGVLANPGVYPGDLSYQFDGVGNAVSTNFDDVLPVSADFSVFVTAVFAQDYQAGGRMLFSNNNAQAGRVDFGINGTATIPHQLTFFLGGTTNMAISFTDSTEDPILFDGEFHEVGITRSGSTFQLYVDGNAVGDAGTSSINISDTLIYRIGRRNGFSGFFNNRISEVQVFNDVRSNGLAVVPEPSVSLLGLSAIGFSLLIRRRN